MMSTVQRGARIVRFNVAATALFLAVAGVAGVWDGARTTAVVVFLALFVVGVFCFLASYATALERSRTDEIGTANLYLLTGPTADRSTKALMSAALGVQVLVSLVVTLVGLRGLGESDPNPLAFAVLVPMLGLGLNGLWASRHGSFGPRILSTQPIRRPSDPPPESEQEQNHHHG